MKSILHKYLFCTLSLTIGLSASLHSYATQEYFATAQAYIVNDTHVNQYCAITSIFEGGITSAERGNTLYKLDTAHKYIWPIYLNLASPIDNLIISCYTTDHFDPSREDLEAQLLFYLDFHKALWSINMIKRTAPLGLGTTDTGWMFPNQPWVFKGWTLYLDHTGSYPGPSN